MTTISTIGFEFKQRIQKSMSHHVERAKIQHLLHQYGGSNDEDRIEDADELNGSAGFSSDKQG